jgi:predicted nucleotidyltransferase
VTVAAASDEAGKHPITTEPGRRSARVGGWEEAPMFDVVSRDEVEDYVLRLARGDERITAAAVVGSRAHTDGDQWSDIDLTFAIADETAPAAVLDEWTAELRARFDGTPLFDLAAGPVTYRVFLLPGALQVDLSVTPTSRFAARGDAFRLLFGSANEPVAAVPRDSTVTFGHAVHHAVRARVCIERERGLQAEYWISCLRNETLALASRRAGVEDWHARGAHLLPAETRERFAGALVRSLDPAELGRALHVAVGLLLDQSDEAPALAARVREHLRAVAGSEVPRPAAES